MSGVLVYIICWQKLALVTTLTSLSLHIPSFLSFISYIIIFCHCIGLQKLVKTTREFTISNTCTLCSSNTSVAAVVVVKDIKQKKRSKYIGKFGVHVELECWRWCATSFIALDPVVKTISFSCRTSTTTTTTRPDISVEFLWCCCW